MKYLLAAEETNSEWVWRWVLSAWGRRRHFTDVLCSTKHNSSNRSYCLQARATTGKVEPALFTVVDKAVILWFQTRSQPRNPPLPVLHSSCLFPWFLWLTPLSLAPKSGMPPGSKNCISSLQKKLAVFDFLRQEESYRLFFYTALSWTPWPLGSYHSG